MYRMRNGVQHYAWGSTTEIPRRLGVEPDGRPWAEMWMGIHAQCPSEVEVGPGEWRPLGDLCPDLGFLLKILAAAEPLSLQVHPSRAQAEEGYEREEVAGIPVDHPSRSYRDPNPKPEAIIALTPFEALCGFRPVDQSTLALEAIAGPLLEPWAQFLRSDPSPEGMRLAVGQLLTLAPEQKAAIVDEVEERIDRLAAIDPELVALVHLLVLHHPGDIGVVITLLLNHVSLQPGDGLFLGPGVLHSYVRGCAVEVMANSDNVLRGGLTPKHLDVAEFLRVLDPRSAAPTVLRPAADGRYAIPEPGFALRRLLEESVVWGPAIIADPDHAASWWVPDGSDGVGAAGWFVASGDR